MSTDKREIDEHTGVETTGHEWDGIKELNNPLPRWWLWIFYATIVWAVIYMVLMPAIPGLPGMGGATPGLRGENERLNVATELAALQEARTPMFAMLSAAESLTEIERDPQLLRFALEAGESAFGDNCATCHGSGAQGFAGYPNLNDDVWLWGGTLADIKHTLTVGIRAEHPETRISVMPAYGETGLLSRAEINDMVEYVVNLSGGEADQAAVGRGTETWTSQCAVCHGPSGQGLREFGAPNLTDAEWLYGGDRETIYETIYHSRYGVMPHWSDRLDESVIDALAVYVYSLGGGEAEQALETRLGDTAPSTAG